MKSLKHRALNYFSGLSKKQVIGLVDTYSLDFILFGYEPNDYIEVAQGELEKADLQKLTVYRKEKSNTYTEVFEKNVENIQDNGDIDKFIVREKVKQVKKIAEFNKRFSP